MYDEFKRTIAQKFSAKDYLKVNSAICALENYLPKDASSPWPQELRSYITKPTLVAWDGTIGATASFDYRLQNYVDRYFKRIPTRAHGKEKIYHAIGDGKILKNRVEFDVRHFRETIEKDFRFWRTYDIDGEDIILSSNDLLKMLGTASKFRTREVTVCKVAQYYDVLEDSLRIVSFEAAKGIYVHILGKTT